MSLNISHFAIHFQKFTHVSDLLQKRPSWKGAEKKGKREIAPPLGGDVEKFSHFQSGEIRSHGDIFCTCKSLQGGDVEKFGHFHRRKIRSFGNILRFFVHHFLRAMLRKLAIFKKENAFIWYAVLCTPILSRFGCED